MKRYIPLNEDPVKDSSKKKTLSNVSKEKFNDIKSNGYTDSNGQKWILGNEITYTHFPLKYLTLQLDSSTILSTDHNITATGGGTDTRMG